MTDAGPRSRAVAPRLSPPVSPRLVSNGFDAARVALGPKSHEPRNRDDIQHQQNSPSSEHKSH